MKNIAELAQSLRGPLATIPCQDIRDAADTLYLMSITGKDMTMQSDVEWLRRKAKWGGGERYNDVADSIETMRDEIAQLVKALEKVQSFSNQTNDAIKQIVYEAIGIEDE